MTRMLDYGPCDLTLLPGKKGLSLKEVVGSFEQERKLRLNQGAGYQKYKICMWLFSIIKLF